MVIFHRFLYVYQRDNPITTRKAAGAEQRALRDVRHQRYSRGGALYRAGADDLVGNFGAKKDGGVLQTYRFS